MTVHWRIRYPRSISLVERRTRSDAVLLLVLRLMSLWAPPPEVVGVATASMAEARLPGAAFSASRPRTSGPGRVAGIDKDCHTFAGGISRTIRRRGYDVPSGIFALGAACTEAVRLFAVGGADGARPGVGRGRGTSPSAMIRTHSDFLPRFECSSPAHESPALIYSAVSSPPAAAARHPGRRFISRNDSLFGVTRERFRRAFCVASVGLGGFDVGGIRGR